jgi:undecaprenyl-diphosphatase
VTLAVSATLSVWEACLLGLVQGLTEFLPVSSDGHLALTQHFLSPMPPGEKVAVDVALHIGTLAAVVVYFWRELEQMGNGLLGRGGPAYARPWFWLLAIASLPVAVVGFAFGPWVEATFDSLPVVGCSFLLTGTLLYLAGAVEYAARTEAMLTPRDALVVGCFQATALLPGVSRSGTTISAALFRGVRSDVAAKFSFLLAIPAITGAIAVKWRTLAALGPDAHGPLAAGVATSAVTGFAAIPLLLRFLRAGKLRYFAYYCWTLGTLVLAAALGLGVS